MLHVKTLKINESLEVPYSEFTFRASRGGGPGGQNVNKVNSKIALRWNPAQSSSLPAAVRDRFLVRFASRLTSEGELLLYSDRFRDQHRNRDDCLGKLRYMLLAVAYAPKERRETKPTRAAVVRKREEKRRRGEKKRGRGRGGAQRWRGETE